MGIVQARISRDLRWHMHGVADLGEQTVLTRQKEEFEALNEVCPYRPPETVEDVVAQRDCAAKHYYPALLARLRQSRSSHQPTARRSPTATAC